MRRYLITYFCRMDFQGCIPMIWQISAENWIKEMRYLDISNDTSELPGISKGIEGFNSKFDSYIIEQKEHNQWMKGHLLKMDEHNKYMEEHNQRPEKILLKLAD